ncbi:adhesion G-protein coupled receptor D1-like [Eriocheir sinensis]|uniref:adhesion G-protein coupled receptor D1-like n=1 Tax=Eriocheir sinensis TaxID=95602 RepID=UPI0021CA4FD3|nr:adhesion G-protein coupled receptor D1-like [Eriocheir sinensis]XP_050722165.1 adhesion G-protein coupled receptor D1-like [Eriocheir sinensis]
MRDVRRLLVVWGVLLLTLPALCPAADVDGGWSDWSELSSTCTKACDVGSEKKVRSCTNPAPQGNGRLCVTEDGSASKDPEFKLFPCNVHSCWDNSWSEWGNCTVECGRGITKRYAVCGNESLPCVDNQYKEEVKACNTWNKTTCPSPCEAKKCPDIAVCLDKSTETDPVAVCVCTMSYIMNEAKTACILPPPTSPTPRPIPTLPPAQKVVATVISKTASTIIIICVSICLIIFLVLRIFTEDRIIQMNMEISLVLAHAMLMFPTSFTETPDMCRVISIFIHYFFTACFMFMFLEALHMYGYVAYVVKQNGMCSRVQNTLVGWGVATIILLFCICFQYENYGGKYHCWLQADTPLFYGQIIPIVALVTLTFTLIEAAGSANYKPLKGIDKHQRTSAKFSQRTNLIIMPFVFAHMLVGIYSEYEQNLPLYSIFTILNSVTGFLVLFLHCFNNQQVRLKMIGMYRSMSRGGGH